MRLLLVNQLGVNTGFHLLIPYLAVHLSDDLGMSAAVVGIVLGVRHLGRQGLFVIGGSASDRLGARRVIIAGCALRTAGFALFAIGDGTVVLLAASVLSGLAGALLARPRVLVCDEIASGLDTFARRSLLGLLAELLRSGAVPALVLITHDLDAAALADRVAVRENGEIVETGAAADVLTAPRHPFTVELTGAARSMRATGG